MYSQFSRTESPLLKHCLPTIYLCAKILKYALFCTCSFFLSLNVDKEANLEKKSFKVLQYTETF